jgi:hypothetical protein
VRLIFAVAVNAIGRRFPVLYVRCMTVGTDSFGVASFEFEVSEPMVERVFIQDNDECIAALVFSVTR